jgi:hypothetical protein
VTGDRRGRSHRHLVTVLFTRTDSVYRELEMVDCYDEERDARRFTGSGPVIAHPPCALWGPLRAMAKRPKSERDLAHLAVDTVRLNGGVLEHPRGSTLWAAADLPLPPAARGRRGRKRWLPPPETDQWGGFTIAVDQFRFGHLCHKATWLYVCGLEVVDLPQLPPGRTDEPRHIIASSKSKADGQTKSGVNQKTREGTPRALAEWLVETARRTTVPKRWTLFDRDLVAA